MLWVIAAAAGSSGARSRMQDSKVCRAEDHERTEGREEWHGLFNEGTPEFERCRMYVDERMNPKTNGG